MTEIKTRFSRNVGLGMRTTAAFSLTIVVALLVAACGADPTATPTPRPTPTATAAPEAPPWQAEWDATLIAAQAEGEVSIAFGGDPVRVYRPVLDYFQDQFGVRVVGPPGSSRELATKFLAEQEAGRQTTDIVHMAVFGFRTIYANGGFDPLPPEIFIPDILDPATYWNGKLYWATDDNQSVFCHASYVKNPVVSSYYNTDLVTQDDLDAIQSNWDFLDLKWKGKIVTSPGDQDGFEAMVQHPELGKPWVTKLFAELDPEYSRDRQGIADGLARGKWAWALHVGGASRPIEELAQLGQPVSTFSQPLKEIPGMEATTSDLIGVAKGRPHPAAAKLFVNWWLSKEGQMKRQELSISVGTNPSLRVDVPDDFGNTKVKTRKQAGENYLFYTCDQDLKDGAADAEEWTKATYLEIVGAKQ